jgi:hypothetical protein
MNIEIINYSWQYIPRIVYHLHLKRSETPDDIDIDQGRNISIILLLPIWIESVLHTVLDEYLQYHKLKNKNDKESVSKRLMNGLIVDLEKAQWRDYERLAEVILGKKLNKVIDDNTWEAITVLYKFRNSVAHGKPIKGTHSSGISKLDGIHDEILLHLVRKKIIKKNTLRPYSINTVNYFIQETEKFTKALMNKLQDGEENNLANQYELILESAKQE